MTDKLRILFVLQYITRFVSEMENRVAETKRNIDLQNLDAVDIIDYVELLAQYRLAVQIEKDILSLLSLR